MPQRAPENEEKLRLTLEEPVFGLVEPLVWNKRTGHLVGGHMRMRQMDIIHEGRNYFVPVAVVDMEEDDEKELNLILNNPSVQGRFDLPSLETLFRDGNVDPFNSGFSPPDLEVMFGPAVANEFMARFADTPTEGSLLGESPVSDAEADEIAAIKEARKAHISTSREDLRSDHTIVIVFDNTEDTLAVLRALGFSANETFVMAADFFQAVRARPEVIPKLVGVHPSLSSETDNAQSPASGVE